MDIFITSFNEGKLEKHSLLDLFRFNRVLARHFLGSWSLKKPKFGNFRVNS